MISLVQLLKEATAMPKAIILAGAPGAGKSSIVGDIIAGLGLKVLNIDDHFIKNLKDAGVSLDLKKADSEGRSKAAVAMQAAQKTYQDELNQEIEKKGDIVIDGTAASYNKTKELKETLENSGYDVFMVYVYSSLEKSLRKNEDRFERSKGEDRSLMPGIVMQTWANVTKNFEPYRDLFGGKFVATTKDEKLSDSQDLDDIIDKYINPYTPKDTKPKTDKELARAKAQKEKTKQEVKQLMSQTNIDKVLPFIVSPEEAQRKLTQFLG
jgi:adenylate kinase family enzyme